MNTQQYYIEYTHDNNGERWQPWSQKRYLSFAEIKTDVWRLCQQESEYNQQEDSKNSHVIKIQGFRIVQEAIKTQIIFESLLT